MKRRTLLATLSLPVLGALGWSRAARAANSYYSGPVSDHFDGTRFFLPGQPWDKPATEVLRWNLTRKPEPWPARFPSPFADRPPRRIEGRGLRVTLIGHASFLIQTGGMNLLIDPVYAERASPFRFAGPRRVNEPGIALADLPPIDAILLTHNHYDHMDMAALKALTEAHAAPIIAPLGNDAILRAAGIGGRIETRDWGERLVLSDTLAVNFEPSKHWSARGLFDRRHALWSAFVLETPAGIVYHIGDTAYHQPLFMAVREKYGPPRLAILPIGAYEPRWFMSAQHVNPAESVDILLDCGAEAAVGHHWGTFQLTDEAIEEPARALSAALLSRGLSEERFRALRPGEVWQAPPAV